MTPYKNRVIDYNKPVKIYRNLNRGGYSIQQNGLVVAHTDNFIVKKAHFKVNEAGRQRVLNTGRKNVHAYIIGYLCNNPSIKSIDHPFLKRIPSVIRYNPKLYRKFFISNSAICLAVSKALIVKAEGNMLLGYDCT